MNRESDFQHRRPTTQGVAAGRRGAPVVACLCVGLLAAAHALCAAEPVIVNTLGMRLALIPPGEFLMGAADADHDAIDDEKPQHRVRITTPFYVAIPETTGGQFRRFVVDAHYRTDAEEDGRGGYGFDRRLRSEQRPEYTWRNPGFPQTDEHPAVNVSHRDAEAFCKWLSGKEGRSYQLPTEAQWEYNCRAGRLGIYAGSDDQRRLARTANVADAAARRVFPTWNTVSADDRFVFTAPVGQFQPNAFGLFDMYGNVDEWCADWFDPEYYAVASMEDPTGPLTGGCRVSRGGCWLDSPALCRLTRRNVGAPGNRHYGLGFRVCLPAVER